MSRYTQAITAAKSRSLLDAMLEVQNLEGYLTPEAIKEIADIFCIEETHVYETASFYSMIRFEPIGKNVIQICKNAPCHVAGARETVAEFERLLGVEIGKTTKDGIYSLEYTECIGQCQASPSVVINGEIYSEVTADKVSAIIKSMA